MEEKAMTYEERVAYVEALIYVTTVNETIKEEELAYFNQVGQLYGIETGELNTIKKNIINKEKSIEDIFKPINNRSTKLSLIYELLALCYVDESYDVLERHGMRRICDIMGIEEAKLLEIEGVILENIELQKKINTVLERN
jgi:uncharacterized tellurite resistance protein B-like protein